MLAKIGLSLLFATLAICDPKGHRWQHPLSTDRKAEDSHTLFNDRQLTLSLGRSPCPGINAIADHGYLPRNGLNITLEQFVTGFREGLNFDAEFVRDAVKLQQDDLEYCGGPFHNETISIQIAARARQDRFDAARAINKEFTPSNLSSFGESALYLKAMRGQDKETKTKYVQILFRESRFLARNEFLLKRDTRDPMSRSVMKMWA
ncbi:MAG: hypothetical protein Q9199_001868 [Rusavskia elegans]